MCAAGPERPPSDASRTRRPRSLLGRRRLWTVTRARSAGERRFQCAGVVFRRRGDSGTGTILAHMHPASREASPPRPLSSDEPPLPMTRALMSASVPTVRRVAGALALVLLGCAGTARAQGAPTLEWELLGLEDEPLTSLFFAPGPAGDGSADTLYSGGVRGLWRREPSGAWSSSLCDPCSADHAARTREGYLLVGAAAGATRLDRSTDGGQTWEQDVFDHVTALYQSTLPALGGAVYGGAYPFWRSLEGGAEGSWEPLGWPGGETASLGEVRGGALLPDGDRKSTRLNSS